MGLLLMKYYQYIGEVSGLDGRIRLAQDTKMPSSKASVAPDNSENIDLFKKAVADITGKPAPDL